MDIRVANVLKQFSRYPALNDVSLDIKSIEDNGDLRRRWAMGRLDELISEAAGHAALVDLGVRQGIITPVTSIYVPTSSEMTPAQRATIDRATRKRTRVVPEEQESGEGRPELAASKADGKEGGTGARAKSAEGAKGHGLLDRVSSAQ